MDHQQIAQEAELETGQTPEAMAGAASKQIDKENGDEKSAKPADQENDKAGSADESLQNSVDDSKGIIAH